MLALASVLKPLAKAGSVHPLLVWMPAGMRLLDQGIQVPENMSRSIPDWVFPNVLAPLLGNRAALMLSL
eukprot:334991-Pelagomonas_calceolata.AAC.1